MQKDSLSHIVLIKKIFTMILWENQNLMLAAPAPPLCVSNAEIKNDPTFHCQALFDKYITFSVAAIE